MRSDLRTLFSLTATLGSLAACSNNNAPDLGVATTHVSRVTGRVVSPSGTPLDSVEVAVFADRAGYGYMSDRGRTNLNGEFSYEIRRITAPSSVPQPDTVNAQVRVMSIRPRDLVNGQAPTASGTALLTFVPNGQTPSPAAVQITLNR